MGSPSHNVGLFECMCSPRHMSSIPKGVSCGSDAAVAVTLACAASSGRFLAAAAARMTAVWRVDAMRGSTCTSAKEQGLTLVHLSAHRKQFPWDTLGIFSRSMDHNSSEIGHKTTR